MINESVIGLLLLLGLMLAGVVWRRWSWSAGLPFLVVVLALIAWLAESNRPAHLPRTALLVVLTRSVLMVPLALFIACLCRSLVRGDWRTLARIAVLTAGLAVIGGAVWFAIDRRTLMPGEYYLWSGWYSTFLTGAYLAGIVAGVLWLSGRLRNFLAQRSEPRPSHPVPRTVTL
jgi:hypothetical protein